MDVCGYMQTYILILDNSFLYCLQQCLLPKEALTPHYWNAGVTTPPLSPGAYCYCNGLSSRSSKPQPVKVTKHPQKQLPKRGDFLKT